MIGRNSTWVLTVVFLTAHALYWAASALVMTW